MKYLIKTIAILFTSIVIHTAQAEVSYEVQSLSEVSFDGTNLTVGYSTGGGCAEHETRVNVRLAEKADSALKIYTSVFKVEVFDVTANGDMCEAMLYLKHQVNLKALIKAEALKQGLNDEYYVDLQLPKVSVDLYN